jgi:hypothetical protein
MSMRVASKSTVGRFSGPAGYDKLQAKLKTAETSLTKANKAVAGQQKIMTLSRFTPDGYKKAEAKLESLQDKAKKLQTEVNTIKRELMSA